MKLVQVLLDRGDRVASKADNGQHTVVRVLLQSGGDTEVKTRIGRMALHLAAINSQAHTVLVLLARGEKKARTALKETAPHLALLKGSLRTILALVLKGSNLTAKPGT